MQPTGLSRNGEAEFFLEVEMDREERARQQAATELERHREKLVERWGDNYVEHLAYQQALEQVANGRTARLVLEDFPKR